MDWGVVASVIVGNILSILGFIIFAGFIIVLIIKGIKSATKKKIPSPDTQIDKNIVEEKVSQDSCPIVFCPMNKTKSA